MNFFAWLFRKKKTEEPPIDPLQESVGYLHQMLEGSGIDEDTVVLGELRILIRVACAEATGTSLQFTAVHPLFLDPFSDVVSGSGKTVADAVHAAVDAFILGALCGIRRCTERLYARDLETKYLGRRRQWHVSVSGVEAGQAADLWDVLAPGLALHLGNQKLCWVKVLVTRTREGALSCECRLGDAVSPGLTWLVSDAAAAWPRKSEAVTMRLFFFLTQDDTTYLPYPYSREYVRGCTARGMRQIADSRTEEQFIRLQDELLLITKDRSLAAELFAFLPEICAENAFAQVAFSESFTLALFDGRRQEVGKNQFTTYRIMQRRVLEGIEAGEFSREDCMTLISLSETYSALSKLLESGAKLEGAALESVVLRMPDGYVTR